MPEFSIGGAFKGYRALSDDQQVKLNASGSLLKKGDIRPGNIFSRFIAWASRSDEQVVANKRIAADFVKEVRARYGDPAADLVQDKLSSHLAYGRPLTVYRIHRSLAKADRMLYGDMPQAERDRAEQLGMTPRQIMAYRKAQIPIHPLTMVGELDGSRVKGRSHPLSGGNLSTVYALTYRVGHGRERHVAFKEAEPDAGLAVGKVSGITPERACMAGRSIASRAVDKALGFNLIPETQIATYKGRVGIAMDLVAGSGFIDKRDVVIGGQEGRRLIHQAKDPHVKMYLEDDGYRFGTDEHGKPQVCKRMTVFNDLNYKDPEVRRALVQMQLLDALCGQVDRHGGNYLLERDSRGNFVALRGIDNDQAFGCRLKDPNDIAQAAPKNPSGTYGYKGYRGVTLPEVVDREMKEAFDRMSENDLRAMLDGLLPPEDVDAAVVRLKAIKEHLDGLQKQGKVIEPDQWGGSIADQGLKSRYSSYVGRDLHIMRKEKDHVVSFPLPSDSGSGLLSST